MHFHFRDELGDMLSDSESNTIESILIIMNEAITGTANTGEDCRTRCEAAAIIGNVGCDAMKSPVARAACRLAVKVTKDIYIGNC